MESKKQIADSILEAVRQEVTEFLEVEDQITSSLEYEDKVLTIARKFARELVVKSAGKIPKSRNAKKKS